MSEKKPKEIRVDSIITAAVEEFLEKGYDGASVNAIAAKAGVSKGGFYHHFPNKEVLLMKANEKLSEPIVEMAARAMENKSALNGLESYIEEYLHYWTEHPRELSFFFLSMSRSFESELLMGYYKEYVKDSTDFFVGMFQKAADGKEAEIPDPEAYGITLMGALDGVLTYVMVHPDMELITLTERVKKIWINKK